MALFANPALLAPIAPDDYPAIRRLQGEWRKLLDADLFRLDALYAEIIQTAGELLDPPPPRKLNILPFRRRSGPALSESSAYVFLNAASNGSYLTQYNGKTAAHQRLAEHHQTLLTLIRRFTATPDRRLSERHLPTDNGNLSDCGQALIELYFHHTTYGPQADRLRAEVAALIPAFMRAFPTVHGGLITSLLEKHPEGAAAVAPLLAFYVTERGMIDSDTVKHFAWEMLGGMRNRDDFYFRNAGNLLVPLLAWVREDPGARLDPFINRFVLEPLDCEPPDRDAEITRLEHNIARARARIHNPAPDTPRVLSPEVEADILASNRAQLERLLQDFDGWLNDRWRIAVQQVAVSATLRRTLTALRKGLAPFSHARLDQLLADAADYRNRPRKFPMPKKSDNRFKDFSLKLMVIEELMYRREALQPRFDIREFAQEYDKREISVEDDGYAIIPEAETYFRNLAIPDELLASVDCLHLSSGLDGGSGFMNQLWPFWDPGCGDEAIPLTPAAAGDLALLPNLKRITGLENGNPGPKLLKALAARGIVLLPEDQG